VAAVTLFYFQPRPVVVFLVVGCGVEMIRGCVVATRFVVLHTIVLANWFSIWCV